jgi:hypothetical protein
LLSEAELAVVGSATWATLVVGDTDFSVVVVVDVGDVDSSLPEHDQNSTTITNTTPTVRASRMMRRCDHCADRRGAGRPRAPEDRPGDRAGVRDAPREGAREEEREGARRVGAEPPAGRRGRAPPGVRDDGAMRWPFCQPTDTRPRHPPDVG